MLHEICTDEYITEQARMARRSKGTRGNHAQKKLRLGSQLLARSSTVSTAATAAALLAVPLLQVLAGQRGVQRSTQLQHALIQGEARGVQAMH